MAHLDQDRLIAKIDLTALVQVSKILSYVADKSSSYRGSRLIRRSIKMLSKEIDRAIVLGVKMSSFTKPLIVKKLPSGLWETVESFEYRVGSENSEEVVKVPKGFKTDFASVPRIFWIILPPDGKYSQSAVLHDILYRDKIYSRKRSDQIFVEAMTVLGVAKGKRLLMYSALRIFGFISWNK